MHVNNLVYIIKTMKEGMPKRETKSKGHSKHMEWEATDAVFMVPMFPLFLFGALFEDLF